MKWITHQTGAALLAIALELPLTGIAATVVGAVLPDMVDQRISSLGFTRKQKQRIFNNIHRGSSHWFGWWLGFVLVILMSPMAAIYKEILAALGIGALSHVCLDMLTPQGVPFLPFSGKGRISLPLCSTGKISEYIFLLAMLAVGVVFFGADITRHLSNDITSLSRLLHL